MSQVTLDYNNLDTDEVSIESDLDDNNTTMDTLFQSISNTFSEEEKTSISLKKVITYSALLLLALLIIVTSTVVILQGLGVMHLEQWTLNLFIVSVLVEVIGVVKIIVGSLFPKDDRKTYLDFIKEFTSRNN